MLVLVLILVIVLLTIIITIMTIKPLIKKKHIIKFNLTSHVVEENGFRVEEDDGNESDTPTEI